jgi:hypothetical protein
MARRIVRLVMGAVLVGAIAAPVGAEGWHGGGVSVRLGDRDAPVKDCTRFNGRFGYYDNPWCTPAEQARFDRWQANRRSAR